jgi:hypothetical protein
MARLHFIGGEKGGVGKSFTARLLAQYHIDHHWPFAGFDTDASHHTFSRFYGEFTQALQIDREEDLDQIALHAEQHPDTDILVDLAAQTAAPLLNWAKGCALFDLTQDMGIDILYWHVMDDGADSANLLTPLIQHWLHPNIRVIAVKNLGRADDFSPLAKSAAYINAQKHAVTFISLPKLASTITQKIDFAHCSFWAAHQDAGVMSTLERYRVKTWLKSCYDEFDRVLQSPPPDATRHQSLSVSQE